MMSFEDLEKAVIFWAHERGILPDRLENATRTKLCKVMEEVGEIAHGEVRKLPAEIEDAIGDTLITLAIYSSMYDLDSGRQCLQQISSCITR